MLPQQFKNSLRYDLNNFYLIFPSNFVGLFSIMTRCMANLLHIFDTFLILIDTLFKFSDSLGFLHIFAHD